MQFGFGGGSLYGVRTDVTGQTPMRFGALQDVSLDFTGDLKELYGQGQYALALARGKTKIELKAKFAQINSLLYNNLYFGQTLTTGAQILLQENEGAVVPASSPYTVASANAATFIADLGVYYAATGVPLLLTTGTPAQGKYTQSGGTYTFAAADEGIAILLNYTYSNASGGPKVALANPRMGSVPSFQTVFSQIFNGQEATFTLNNCSSSKLSLPTKQDDWTITELDFMVAADASGNIGTIGFAT